VLEILERYDVRKEQPDWISPQLLCFALTIEKSRRADFFRNRGRVAFEDVGPGELEQVASREADRHDGQLQAYLMWTKVTRAPGLWDDPLKGGQVPQRPPKWHPRGGQVPQQPLKWHPRGGSSAPMNFKMTGSRGVKCPDELQNDRLEGDEVRR